MEKYKIYEDGEHHLGLISNDGKHKTPAVYDEIQIREDGIWYCRAYINWDYFYPASGTFSVKTRKGTIEGSNGRKVGNGGGPTTIEDREVYDSISERKTSQYIFTYEYGKFGLKSLDGLVILDAIYDDIDVWENANVIQVRLGDKHYYFNDQKEQILTDEPSCMEQDVPYWDGMGWNHFMVREIVDKVSDNHTYLSNVGFVRIDHREVKEVVSMLQANCERIPIKIDSIKDLTDQYSYEFGMNILKLKTSVDGIITEEEWKSGIDKLESLGAFGNSWHYIDKFVTNSKTKLSVKSLYWLKHRYDMECDVLGDLCFAYGLDETLKDGEVKWIHVEHYNEHCFPEDYGVCDAMQYDTLNELKEIIESHDWNAQGDPYGGCFFAYCNIRYPEGRPWDETEKILNYMLELGHKPEELTKCVVERLQYDCDTPEEMDFWENCAGWALSMTEFPNYLSCGQTCYDEFLNVRLESKPEEVQTRIKKLGNLFLLHGARTSKQQAEYNLQNIEGIENVYDYSIIDTW